MRARTAIPTWSLALSLALVEISYGATVAYYRFEEGVVGMTASGNIIFDSSGNGLNATPSGSPIYSANVPISPIGSNRLSLQFNGTTSRVFIPDYSQLRLTNSLTVEAFVNIQGPPLPGLNRAQIFFRGDDRVGLDPYFLAVASSNLLFALTDSNNNTVTLQAPISFFQWHHVAGTLDATTRRISLYIDGQLVGTKLTSIRPLDLLTGGNPGCGIGNLNSDNYAEYFNGYIDEVRISDTALSPGEFLNASPVVVLRQPVLLGGGIQLGFDVIAGNPGSFSLLQAGNIAGPWTTNFDAILSTNGSGAYTFDVSPVIGSNQFYRIESH